MSINCHSNEGYPAQISLQKTNKISVHNSADTASFRRTTKAQEGVAVIRVVAGCGGASAAKASP
jgi:hypothetical protein